MVNNPTLTQRTRKPPPHTKTRKTEETEKTAWILTLSHRVGGESQYWRGFFSFFSFFSFLGLSVFLTFCVSGGFPILATPPTMAMF